MPAMRPSLICARTTIGHSFRLLARNYSSLALMVWKTLSCEQTDATCVKS